MTKTSKLQVVTKDANGKELNRTVSYVNPETSDSDLTRFATAYSGLSRRTYKDVYRIDREDITDATTETAIMPSVTISNGVLTLTSPYFTPSRESELANKIICSVVNDKYAGANSGLTFKTVTGIAESSNGYNVYGTLSDGSVSNAENAESKNCYITSSQLAKDAEFLMLYTNYAETQTNTQDTVPAKYVSLNCDDFINRFMAGTLNITNCVADLNALLATEFNGDILGGVPTFAYNPAAGSVTFTPTFTQNSTYGFVVLTGDNGGNVLLRELIGTTLFDSYRGTDVWHYVISNPNYSA